MIALVQESIRTTISRIIFNGDGYAPAWEKEAEKRGLLNLKSVPEAMPYMVSDKNVALLEEFGVLTKTEVESRCEVALEQYSKLLHIEAVAMLEIAHKQIVPAINTFMTDTAATITSKQAACPGISCKAETKLLKEMSTYSDEICERLDVLNAAVEEAEAQEGALAIAKAYHDKAEGCHGEPACRQRQRRGHLRRRVLAHAQLLLHALLHHVILPTEIPLIM